MKKSTTTTLILVLLAVFSLAASPMQDSSKYRPVLEALSMVYAPTPEDRAGWTETICQRMTAGGCEIFMEAQTDLLWQNGQEVAFNSVVPVGVVAALPDGSQVWKANISIFNACTSKDCLPTESDLYLHVVHDEAQDAWLLNRILYGPYIAPPQFEEK
ncbi:hypothetical protein ANAEL_00334 [Anaerolineales bacterium]|nr:hypothetical protein ANAEL_00334 [Anaerolineales bacterium]